MKYIIWGAGRRGERVLRSIGEADVIAYIDVNKDKIGKYYCGKEIISFEKYLTTYTDAFLVISPRDYQDIVCFLKNKNINQYFIFEDCPSELFWVQDIALIQNLFLRKYRQEECIGIYGIELFSIMLYDFAQKHGYEKVFLINNEEYGYQVKLEQLGYKFQAYAGNVDRILVTNRNFKDAIIQYKNCKIDDFYDFSYQVDEYRNELLSRFKNIHSGQRCFIVATGPSLRLDDLECLRRNQEITMSVNMVFNAFPLVKWRPDYYVMSDLEGIKFYEKEIKELTLANIFIPGFNVAFWENTLPSNFYKYHCCTAFDGDVLKFSDNIVSGMYTSGTVVYVCLQLAMYMGFKEIYLVGTDCNYKKDVKNPHNHFIKNYYNKNDTQAMPFALDEVILGYQVAHHYAKRHGIKIYNATRGGNLEVFERVDFDSLFE